MTVRATAMVLACVVAFGATAIGLVMASVSTSLSPASSQDPILAGPVANRALKADAEFHPNREAKQDRLKLALVITDPALREQDLDTPGDVLRQSFEAISLPGATAPIDTPSAPPPAATPPKPPASPIAGIRNPLLNDAQIDGIRKRLKLTSAQEKHWPAVKSALHEIIKSYDAKRKKAGRNKAVALDPGSAEVRQLKDAATPLLAQLQATQKRELQMLARIIGLDSVLAKL